MKNEHLILQGVDRIFRVGQSQRKHPVSFVKASHQTVSKISRAEMQQNGIADRIQITGGQFTVQQAIKMNFKPTLEQRNVN